MLIKKIKARNFKTYLDLELDLSTESEQPIILIGGANGGGKTTLFDAIYGALYGLNIASAQHFIELVNAGALDETERKITLEIHFSGKVLNQDQSYVLTRTYILNPENKPVESVRLNMNGTIFQYGTATPPPQRIEQESQVNKIIKANLPEALSHYFLFDAMESGNLLKEDRLNKVIKENIENVMGFNKYLDLSTASNRLLEEYTAQKLSQEKEKTEYTNLVKEKDQKKESIQEIKNKLQEAYDYSINNKELYETAKEGLNKESLLKNKIDQLKQQINQTEEKYLSYRSSADDFIKQFEKYVLLPKLAERFKSEISLILKENNERKQEEKERISNPFLEEILGKAVQYLNRKGFNFKDLSVSDIAEAVIHQLKQERAKEYRYDYFSENDLKALESLISSNYTNPFPLLDQQKMEVELALKNKSKLEQQINEYKAQLSGDDYTVIKMFEQNEGNIKNLELKQKEEEQELHKIEKRLHQYDIQTSEEPDPKYDALKKLGAFFEDAANKLLKSKKEQIQLKMKQDLNANLAAYRDVIDRVTLSEDLKNLSFKIFHKAGNEIYLNQLNTASKQVVVQVLLKALHEFGDYDPPVMIDTVMGVLDLESRATILENYFPVLSHQTILLSSDSEIDKDSDFPKIAPFVSKAFTLKRNKEKQYTEVIEGYFGQLLN